MSNLFANLPSTFPSEVIETLLKRDNVRIERIVSCGQASPDSFWYDQPEDEWVVLLTGAARLEFVDGTLDLRPGDFIHLPAHRRHRVAWTTPDEPTVWLAVFFVVEAD